LGKLIIIGQADNQEELDEFLDCIEAAGIEYGEFKDVSYIFNNFDTEAPKIIEQIKPKTEIK